MIMSELPSQLRAAHAVIPESVLLKAATRIEELEEQLKAGSEPVEIDWPEYHHQGMGCGLEDRCITDRYEAMAYGFEQALEMVAERLPDVLYTTPPDTAALDALLADRWISVDDRLPEDYGSYMVSLENGAVFQATYSMPFNCRWFIVGVGDIVFDNPVTHWQPLPPAPTGKEG